MKVSMIAEYYTADSSSFSALELDAKNLQLHFNFTRCYVLLHNFFLWRSCRELQSYKTDDCSIPVRKPGIDYDRKIGEK